MKREPKQGTGLYAYLSSTGVLEQGTEAQIKQAKKKYWTQYRKAWKKNKRQQSKVCILLFSFREAREIAKKADARHITANSYIKQVALTGAEVIGPVLKGKIREQLIRYTSQLETKAEKYGISEAIINVLIEEAVQIEEDILSLLNNM
jgi:hypothetical protein